LQAVIRIIALSSDARLEIRKLVRIVVERMQLRVLINLEIGRFLRRVVKSNEALDVEVGAAGVEIEKRDAITKDVVNPPQTDRLRRNRQMRLQQALIEAIARTKKQPMPAKTHRPLVPILGQVPD